MLPCKCSYSKLLRHYFSVRYFISKIVWKLLWKLKKVKNFPWMVIYAAQKASYSGTSRKGLFRRITVQIIEQKLSQNACLLIVKRYNDCKSKVNQLPWNRIRRCFITGQCIRHKILFKFDQFMASKEIRVSNSRSQ